MVAVENNMFEVVAAEAVAAVEAAAVVDCSPTVAGKEIFQADLCSSCVALEVVAAKLCIKL